MTKLIIGLYLLLFLSLLLSYMETLEAPTVFGYDATIPIIKFFVINAFVCALYLLVSGVLQII